MCVCVSPHARRKPPLPRAGSAIGRTPCRLDRSAQPQGAAAAALGGCREPPRERREPAASDRRESRPEAASVRCGPWRTVHRGTRVRAGRAGPRAPALRRSAGGRAGGPRRGPLGGRRGRARGGGHSARGATGAERRARRPGASPPQRARRRWNRRARSGIDKQVIGCCAKPPHRATDPRRPSSPPARAHHTPGGPAECRRPASRDLGPRTRRRPASRGIARLRRSSLRARLLLGAARRAAHVAHRT